MHEQQEPSRTRVLLAHWLPLASITGIVLGALELIISTVFFPVVSSDRFGALCLLSLLVASFALMGIILALPVMVARRFPPQYALTAPHLVSWGIGLVLTIFGSEYARSYLSGIDIDFPQYLSAIYVLFLLVLLTTVTGTCVYGVYPIAKRLIPKVDPRKVAIPFLGIVSLCALVFPHLYSDPIHRTDLSLVADVVSATTLLFILDFLARRIWCLQ